METESKQYTLVKEAREVLFAFCESIKSEDYAKKIKNFGWESIRNTQAHIADTYIHWIGNFALKKDLPYLKAESIDSVEKMRDEFLKVNKLVDEFIEKFYRKENDPITNEVPNKGDISITPLALFTHVITHEFHHKGQLVTMSRIRGYEPPDTDLIRT